MEASGTATVQVAFTRAFGAGRVTVINLAISGTTSGQLVAAFPAQKFDIVVDNHGINDCWRGVSVETFKDNLRALVDNGVTVLETQNPVTAYQCQAFAAATREVAAEKGVQVVDTQAYVYTLSGWAANTPDGVHPNEGLYTMIAVNRAAELMPKVRALVCR